MSLYLGWWAYPIYTNGDYLQLMKDTLSDAGEWNEAWNLTEDQKNMLRNSSGQILLTVTWASEGFSELTLPLPHLRFSRKLIQISSV